MLSWHAKYTQTTPTEERLYVTREKVPGMMCDQCGSDDVRRYPIANHLGPRMVTKCQSCFHVLTMDRPKVEDNWPPFRSLTYEWEASLSERASRAQTP